MREGGWAGDCTLPVSIARVLATCAVEIGAEIELGRVHFRLCLRLFTLSDTMIC